MTINAEKLSDLFTEARETFKHERYNSTDIRKCKACGAWVINVAQHWNDVGGVDTLECEMCWVESWICFNVSEDEAAQEIEMPIFGTKMHESIEQLENLGINNDE